MLAAGIFIVTVDVWVFSTFCAITATGLSNSAATKIANVPAQSVRPPVVTSETVCPCAGNHPKTLFLICTVAPLIACRRV